MPSEEKSLDLQSSLLDFPLLESWRLFIDGIKQISERNWFAFEQREVGYLKANFRAFSYALAKIKEPLSLEFIIKIQHLTMEDVGNTAYDKNIFCEEKRGKIRGTTMSYGLTPDFCSIAGLTEIFDKIETTHPYLSLSVQDPDLLTIIHAGMLKNLSDENKKIMIKQVFACIQKAPYSQVMLTSCATPEEIIAHLNQFIEEFNCAVVKAKNNQQEKLVAIIIFVKNCEQLHPFYDGNGRTFYMVIFYQLLIKNGFKLPLMLNINRLSAYSTHELETEVHEGWSNVEKLLAEKTLFEVNTHNLLKMAPEKNNYFFSSVRLLFNFATTADKNAVEELISPVPKTTGHITKIMPTQYPATLYSSSGPRGLGRPANLAQLNSIKLPSVNYQITEKVGNLFQLKCIFWDSSLGLSIEVPSGTSLEKIHACELLLKDLDIDVTIKPEETFAAELLIKNETPESLNEKLPAATQNIMTM